MNSFEKNQNNSEPVNKKQVQNNEMNPTLETRVVRLLKRRNSLQENISNSSGGGGGGLLSPIPFAPASVTTPPKDVKSMSRNNSSPADSEKRKREKEEVVGEFVGNKRMEKTNTTPNLFLNFNCKENGNKETSEERYYTPILPRHHGTGIGEVGSKQIFEKVFVSPPQKVTKKSISVSEYLTEKERQQAQNYHQAVIQSKHHPDVQETSVNTDISGPVVPISEISPLNGVSRVAGVAGGGVSENGIKDEDRYDPITLGMNVAWIEENVNNKPMDRDKNMAYVMSAFQYAMEKGGFVQSYTNYDISIARTVFIAISSCDEDMIKIRALDYVNYLLEHVECTAFGASNILSIEDTLRTKSMTLDVIQNLNVYTQIKLARTYALTIECMLQNIYQGSASGITQSRKDEIWDTANRLKKLNRDTNSMLKFETLRIIEAAKRLLSDQTTMERVAGKSGMVTSALLNFKGENYSNAFSLLQQAMYHSSVGKKWFDQFLEMKKISKYAMIQPQMFKVFVDLVTDAVIHKKKHAWTFFHGIITYATMLFVSSNNIVHQSALLDRAILPFLTFEGFRFTNNWRVRFKAMDSVFRILRSNLQLNDRHKEKIFMSLASISTSKTMSKSLSSSSSAYRNPSTKRMSISTTQRRFHSRNDENNSDDEKEEEEFGGSTSPTTRASTLSMLDRPMGGFMQGPVDSDEILPLHFTLNHSESYFSVGSIEYVEKNKHVKSIFELCHDLPVSHTAKLKDMIFYRCGDLSIKLFATPEAISKMENRKRKKGLNQIRKIAQGNSDYVKYLEIRTVPAEQQKQQQQQENQLSQSFNKKRRLSKMLNNSAKILHPSVQIPQQPVHPISPSRSKTKTFFQQTSLHNPSSNQNSKLSPPPLYKKTFVQMLPPSPPLHRVEMKRPALPATKQGSSDTIPAQDLYVSSIESSIFEEEQEEEEQQEQEEQEQEEQEGVVDEEEHTERLERQWKEKYCNLDNETKGYEDDDEYSVKPSMKYKEEEKEEKEEDQKEFSKASINEYMSSLYQQSQPSQHFNREKRKLGQSNTKNSLSLSKLPDVVMNSIIGDLRAMKNEKKLRLSLEHQKQQTKEPQQQHKLKGSRKK